MVRIRRQDLTGIISCLICDLLIHIERDSNLCEDAGMYTHVVKTFLVDRFQLVTEGITNGRLPNLDG